MGLVGIDAIVVEQFVVRTINIVIKIKIKN